ncbi:HAMP domain-containing histidine kinase [Paenibacillus sp. N3/727]|uniref:sensor histidine kinase n=1 Tax=Paenibacillus sp. N3/727 TaxID=2925845 RepID=UPI001F536608|nr:HAMP domain-containing sensor histidine kinase [Paenibacillus sp. N3/727]UNK19202.1 HAMP domain-containing histidine kinase [Paenibacillus sp. N3/727]
MSIGKKIALIFGMLQLVIGFGYLSLYVWSSGLHPFSIALWSDYKLWLALLLFLGGLVAVYIAAVYIGYPFKRDLKKLENASPSSLDNMNMDSQKDEWQQLMLYTTYLARRLEEDSEVKERILADAVHEMRTPLSVIRGQVESILEGTLAYEPEQLLPLLDETSRLTRLIHDLRELSRAESGKLKLNYEWIDFSELIGRVWERFEAEAEEKWIQCDKKTEAEKVFCDPQRMEQVLINLIGNAVTYTPNDGFLSIQAKSQDYMLTVTVHNSGEGISLEHLPYVFQRFYRADFSRQRSSGGMGLGLAIAKHYVEAHEGKITVDSNPGKGAVFQFSIPLFPQS